MVWARRRAKLWRSADEERVAAMLLDDERRALIRSVPNGFVERYISLNPVQSKFMAVLAANDWADAVLARYDEEVEEVRGE